MKNRLAVLAALAAFALPAAAQVNRYSATTGDVALTATALTLTIQKPAPTAPGRNVTLESITVYSTVAVNATQSYNGTAATATAATVTAIPPTPAPATATAWTASNVGGGTAVGGIVHVLASVTQAIDVSKVVIAGAGTAANYSLTIASMTGTANITAIWSEQ